MGKRRKEERGQRLFLIRSHILFFCLELGSDPGRNGPVNFGVQQAMLFLPKSLQGVA